MSNVSTIPERKTLREKNYSQQQKNQLPTQARVSAEQLEELRSPDILGVPKFESQAILKQAIEEEISQHLGGECYARLKENRVYRGN